MQPYFSIVIPVFNGAERLALTLDSACKQTFRDFEIIVIDDGSTDNTSKIIADYCEKDSQRIRSFYKENGGVSSARNAGIEKATGIFVTFLDSDDFLDENYLQMMYDILDGTEKVWACCINKENGKIDGTKFTYGGEETLLRYILRGGACPQTACWTIRREWLVESGIVFDENINYTEDYNFFCKFLYYAEKGGGDGGYLKEALVDYILRYGSLCQRERLWLDFKHLKEDFESTKGIYYYIANSDGKEKSVYLNLLRRRLKKKYLYNLWGTLLLGNMDDFKSLRRMYIEDRRTYFLSKVKLSLKYYIWEWATSPIICYLTLILRPYKRFQKSKQRNTIDVIFNFYDKRNA